MEEADRHDPGQSSLNLGVARWRDTLSSLAGLPALHFGEPGQVRKEAATAKRCKCRG